MSGSSLVTHPYPGRGFIIGLTPSGRNYVQIYWTTGRSINSRNRIMEVDNHLVRNLPFRAADCSDPSLTIYNPLSSWQHCHIVSNGHQTDDIVDGLPIGRSFEQTLTAWTFEPDPPHYTPRISGMIDMNQSSYHLSMIRTAANNDPNVREQHLYTFQLMPTGFGYGLITYRGEQNQVLLPYSGDPILLPVFESSSDNLNHYWDQLDRTNRISIVVKLINRYDNSVSYTIKNKWMPQS